MATHFTNYVANATSIFKKASTYFQQPLQPDSAIVTVCAFALRAAQTAPMYASQVKRMFDGRSARGIKEIIR